MPLFLLTSEIVFPDPNLARPDGLLAVGGDLGIKRLISAYSSGIFPWFSRGQPILWWSPDPRLLLFPGEIHVSGSLRKVLRRRKFSITLDTAFERVIRACAAEREKKAEGTWIVPAMIKAYCRLHDAGFAHSVEAWDNEGELSGGLYGVSLGRCFFGESMFFVRPNASKAALCVLAGHLAEKKFAFIDCQLTTPHLAAMGGREVPRRSFLIMLREALKFPTAAGKWNYFFTDSTRIAY
jgi:leucyl/phenylalanyl-tRNA--protein transferase